MNRIRGTKIYSIFTSFVPWTLTYECFNMIALFAYNIYSITAFYTYILIFYVYVHIDNILLNKYIQKYFLYFILYFLFHLIMSMTMIFAMKC